MKTKDQIVARIKDTYKFLKDRKFNSELDVIDSNEAMESKQRQIMEELPNTQWTPDLWDYLLKSEIERHNRLMAYDKQLGEDIADFESTFKDFIDLNN